MEAEEILSIAIKERNKIRIDSLTNEQQKVYCILENLLFDFKYEGLSSELAIADLITIIQTYFKDAVLE